MNEHNKRNEPKLLNKRMLSETLCAYVVKILYFIKGIK